MPAGWGDRAQCVGMDPNLFIGPDVEETPRRQRTRETKAKAVCLQCIVRIPCLLDALERDEQEGVWGGTTAEERDRMLSSALEDRDAS